MAQPAQTINHQRLRNPLDACQYEHLLQADDIELAMLAESDNFLRLLDMSEATQKGECEQLSCAHAIDGHDHHRPGRHPPGRQ